MWAPMETAGLTRTLIALTIITPFKLILMLIRLVMPAIIALLWLIQTRVTLILTALVRPATIARW